MSERQAKIKRKSEENVKTAHKTDRGDIIAKVAAIIVVVAVAAAGVYASRDKIKSLFAAETVSDTQNQTQTVADVAADKDMTGDELLAKLGFEGELTAQSSADELLSKMTIETYAKYEDKTVADFKKEYGIEALADDTLWTEAFMKVPVGIIAEKNGSEFEEYKQAVGLPDSVTEKTTYEDALAAMQTQNAANTNEEE